MNNATPKNQKTIIQQPKKNHQQQSQTTQQHHQKRRHQKKIVVQVEVEDEESHDHVYAGPTFSNAPAPSALPIPAFNARGSPINYHQSIISSSLQQQSMDLMNLIVPPRVVTAYELEQTNMALSEIQRGLRSMLKIES
jgi:hypothetical protein